MRPVHMRVTLHRICVVACGGSGSVEQCMRARGVLPKPSGGVVSRLEDAQSTDSFMYLYVNGHYVEPTPIHESIVRLFAAASLHAQEGSGC